MITINNKAVTVNKFLSGESKVDVKSINIPSSVVVTIGLKFESQSDIIDLMLITQHVKSELRKTNRNQALNLFIPYLPYSRMDRTNGEEVFSLKYFANIINSLEFNEVITYDVHSDTSLALIDNLININYTTVLLETYFKYTCVSKVNVEEEAAQYDPIVVFPDRGAFKRYMHLLPVRAREEKRFIIIDKTRNFSTGDIEKFDIVYMPDNLAKRDCRAVIIDDICSKGGTFEGIAKILKEETQLVDVTLIVTHTENAIKDGTLLTDTSYVDRIVTTDSLNNLSDIPGKLIVVEIF